MLTEKNLPVFGLFELHQFAEFIGDTLSIPIKDQAEAEARQLAPLFKSAAAVLKPHASGAAEKRVLTAKGLHRAFVDVCVAHQTILTGYPIIAGEDFLATDVWMGASGIDEFNLATIHSDEPRGRIFGTALFAFLSMHRDFRRAVTRPYIGLPTEPLAAFCHGYQGPGLLEALGEVAYWVDHDWFHAMMPLMINHKLVSVSHNAPARKLQAEKPPALSEHFNNYALRGQDVFREANSDFHLESWSMRLQREILLHMADQPGNPFTAAIDNYLKAWKEFKRHTAEMQLMTDPVLKPYQYALQLLAFNVARALPKNHPQVQAILHDPDIGKDRVLFDRIYDIRYIRSVVHGAGKKFYGQLQPQADSRRLSQSALEMAAHGITLAHQDAVAALAFEREVLARAALAGTREERKFAPVI